MTNRLLVTYQIKASEAAIQEIAEDICIEQTVEVVRQLAQDEWIQENILGRVEGIAQCRGGVLPPDSVEGIIPAQGADPCVCPPRDSRQSTAGNQQPAALLQAVSSQGEEVGSSHLAAPSSGVFDVVISYPDAILGYQLPQLLSVLYGNISLKSDIRVTGVEFSSDFLSRFSGPGFGIDGIRQLLGVEKRPLLATALKPMGKTPEDLAGLAYRLGLGGVDIIKDDHGLVDHSFCPFKKRVECCLAAINKAEQETGKRVLYFPNITDSYERVSGHAKWAKEMGVGGFLVSPLIVGLDTMRYLADNLGLPLMAHPALMGGLFSGISAEILLGDLMRLAGADLVIYPNYGGRFPFTKEVCQTIGYALKKKMGGLKTAFPVPAGGIDTKNLPGLKQFYGNDAVFLIGSSLYVYSTDLTASVKDCIQHLLGGD